ncbi:MAG: glycosyltransferase family 2 protein [Chloroflexi bacterium]|nr:glycosyltransferase family 2 protein [Chloroflexota bacterium]
MQDRAEVHKAIMQHSNESTCVAMVEAGTVLTPNALYELLYELLENAEADVVFADYEFYDDDGLQPAFKPAWSTELLLSTNLLAPVCLMRRAATLATFGGLPLCLDDWFYDVALRLSRSTCKFVRVPRVLATVTTLHTQPGDSLMTLLESHLSALGLQAPSATFVPDHPVHSRHPLLTWELRASPKVSIIIPTRNLPDVLAKCIASICELTTYPDYEIIIIDTGSDDPVVEALYESFASNLRIRLLRDSSPFNYSRVCNLGASTAQGSLLLFLNNDTEVLGGAWLHRLAQWFELPTVGVVGAKLLFPDGSLQHAGVIVGLHDLADNFMAHLPENSLTVFGSDGWYRNFPAVTGACLMISRPLFEEIGGVDEAYVLNFSDVQLGLDVLARGRRVVYTPHVRLIHHESLTHRRRIPAEDVTRGRAAVERTRALWEGYFHPWLNAGTPRPSLRRPTSPPRP